jgi:hypothetical protein
MDTLNALKIARGHIAVGWAVGSRGTTSGGWPCSGFNPAAVRWCALGAKVYGHTLEVLYEFIPDSFEKRNAERLWGKHAAVAGYNNSTSQAKVQLGLNSSPRLLICLQPGG